ncbi:MAG TPA: hypothetical protein VKT77_21885 [Chthonomonadaceae bacterium]|nr:hypothetical protein [Chthonomonadaceae bacterium]
MWTVEQKQRFQTLRTREREQNLTEPEEAELARMIQELEEEEAAYLRPATQRLEQRNRERAAQNAALKALVEREKRLKRYLQRVLTKVENERRAIAAELETILDASTVSGPGR